jgi:hypothetical protein
MRIREKFTIRYTNRWTDKWWSEKNNQIHRQIDRPTNDDHKSSLVALVIQNRFNNSLNRNVIKLNRAHVYLVGVKFCADNQSLSISRVQLHSIQTPFCTVNLRLVYSLYNKLLKLQTKKDLKSIQCWSEKQNVA